MTTERQPTGLQWLWGMRDWPEFEKYQRMGGGLGYEAWKRKGKPEPPTPITSYARDILERTGGVPPGTITKESEMGGLPNIGERVGVEKAFRGVEKPSAPSESKLMPLQFKTYEKALEAAPEGWDVDRDEFGYFTIKRVPTKAREDMPEGFWKSYKEAASAAPEGWTPYQAGGGWFGIQEVANQEPTKYERYGTSPYDNPETSEVEGQWNPYSGQWEQPAGWQSPYEKAMLEHQQATLGWQREQSQMQQREQERQYKSQLLANPMSWLQYSAYAGETPAIQPWMQGLMGGQYQAGGALPGWQPGGAEGQPMSSLPELREPGGQTWARMGPTAQQQYMGYRQARSGITPEETMFRRRAGSAPSGRYGGLRWMR